MLILWLYIQYLLNSISSVVLQTNKDRVVKLMMLAMKWLTYAASKFRPSSNFVRKAQEKYENPENDLNEFVIMCNHV